MNTIADTNRLKAMDTITALFMPFLIRYFSPAPKFWAIKVENAFPKSCTGI